MRLIDADKLLDALCDGCTGAPCEGNRHGSMEECQSVRIMRDVIHEQPTAYDVDKVAIELWEQSFNDVEEGIYDNGYTFISTSDAINIARKGGVDG